MDYFKHYSTASEGNTLNHIEDKFGHLGYASWFKLIELCCLNWDGKSAPEFTFFETIVRRKLKISRTKLELFLGFCSEVSELSYRFSEKNIHIRLPMLAEIKETRGRISGNKFKKTDIYRIDKEEEKERDKEKDLSHIEIPSQLAGIKSPDDLIQFWNTEFLSKGYPACPLSLGGNNRTNFFLINKRLLENKSTWMDYLHRVDASEFLTKKKKGGKPPITWLLSEMNFDDVWAGKYDKNGTSDQIDDYLASIKLEA